GSCSKFIDKSPQDQILSSDYWTQPNDIKLFANQYYQWIPSHGNFSPGLFGGDNNSDNMIPGNFNQRLAGTSTLNNASVLYNSTLQNWDYSRVRSLNYALENY